MGKIGDDVKNGNADKPKNSKSGGMSNDKSPLENLRSSHGKKEGTDFNPNGPGPITRTR